MRAQNDSRPDPQARMQIELQVMVYFLLCNRGLLFAILVSGCRAMKRQTWHILAVSLRCEVSVCYITFKTPTMQLAVGNWGWAFGSSASRVPPDRTQSRFSLFHHFNSTDQPSVYTLCPKINRKLQGHKVPTEHTEQKQAENTWDSQVQPQFFCHFVQNGVSIVVIISK